MEAVCSCGGPATSAAAARASPAPSPVAAALRSPAEAPAVAAAPPCCACCVACWRCRQAGSCCTATSMGISAAWPPYSSGRMSGPSACIEQEVRGGSLVIDQRGANRRAATCCSAGLVAAVRLSCSRALVAAGMQLQCTMRSLQTGSPPAAPLARLGRSRSGSSSACCCTKEQQGLVLLSAQRRALLGMWPQLCAGLPCSAWHVARRQWPVQCRA